MKSTPTLFSLFESHCKKGTCKFKNWCDLVKWNAAEKPSLEVLATLKELSAECYSATQAPKPAAEKKTKKPAEKKEG
jgi:Tfp pilus assembly protein PilP